MGTKRLSSFPDFDAAQRAYTLHAKTTVFPVDRTDAKCQDVYYGQEGRRLVVAGGQLAS